MCLKERGSGSGNIFAIEALWTTGNQKKGKNLALLIGSVSHALGKSAALPVLPLDLIYLFIHQAHPSCILRAKSTGDCENTTSYPTVGRERSMLISFFFRVGSSDWRVNNTLLRCGRLFQRSNAESPAADKGGDCAGIRLESILRVIRKTTSTVTKKKTN